MFENSGLSRYKVGKIIECFCIDIDATRTALLLKLNRKTVNRYFPAFRRLIYLHQVSKKEQIPGVVEVDESFFGPARVRGRPGPRKRGRGTLKQPVFGIYERDGAVYTELVTRTARPKRFRPSSEARFRLRALSIPTAGKAMTDWWTWGTTNTSASTNPNILRKNRSTSTVSKHSGALQNAAWQSLMV